MNYQEFLEKKRLSDSPTGLSEIPRLSDQLFPFQKDIVTWALRRGRAAVFADCGMGKTAMQLEWARHIPGRVLIVAPLAVSRQTEAEAVKFGVKGVRYQRDDDHGTPIVVTNYEMLHQFDPANFTGIVLDESSILKSYTGKLRNQIIEDWGDVPFKLAATATPAPNDYMELGNHAEFIGAMTRVEMLSMFFVHDGGETQKWRLKGHAESEFWKWMCEWAVMIRKPSDLGYEDGSFILPELHIHEESVHVDSEQVGMLFAMEASTLQERQQARRASVAERVARVAELVECEPDQSWAIWCDRNDESDALVASIPGAVDVTGSHDPETKAERLHAFSNGEIQVLVSKPSIAGWGMNWQHCSRMAFTGLSDSYEQFYQAVRRCWRFGQKQEVHAYIVTSRLEGAVVSNIKRKEAASEEMARQMVDHMRDITISTIRGTQRNDKSYHASQIMALPTFLK